MQVQGIAFFNTKGEFNMKALSYILAFLIAASAPAALARSKNHHGKKQNHEMVQKKKHGKSAKHKAKKEKKRDTASVKSKKHKGKKKKKH